VDSGKKKPKTALLGRFGSGSKRFFAEFVTIVAGVLIALAIDEWRGDIEDANLELQYLGQLIIDLQASEKEIAEAADRDTAPENAAQRFLAAFEDGQPVTRQDAGQWLSEMRLFSTPVPVLGTIEALISTGDLRLVQNASVRSEITQYLSASQNEIGRFYQYEDLSRNLYIQILVLAQTHGITPAHRSGLAHEVSGSEAEAEFAAFFANPEAYALVERFVANKSRMASHRDSMATEAAKLRELLAAQL